MSHLRGRRNEKEFDPNKSIQNTQVWKKYQQAEEEVKYIEQALEEYFDYNQMTPGIKYKSFGDFIENLDGVAKLDYGVERERVRKILFDDYQYDACERTYKYFIGEDY